MKRTEHEEISIKMFGGPYSEVHAFLDQYFSQYGPHHRVVLHHQAGVSEVIRQFGGGTRPVAEQHIIDDLGFVPNDFNHREFYIDKVCANIWLSIHELGEEQDLELDLRKLYGFKFNDT